jgi:hypothetical protein
MGGELEGGSGPAVGAGKERTMIDQCSLLYHAVPVDQAASDRVALY